MGFKLYETRTYKLVSTSDEINQYGIGDILNCTTLYNSQIVAFMFNEPRKRNGVFFFDDRNKNFLLAISYARFSQKINQKLCYLK